MLDSTRKKRKELIALLKHGLVFLFAIEIFHAVKAALAV